MQINSAAKVAAATAAERIAKLEEKLAQLQLQHPPVTPHPQTQEYTSGTANGSEGGTARAADRTAEDEEDEAAKKSSKMKE